MTKRRKMRSLAHFTITAKHLQPQQSTLQKSIYLREREALRAVPVPGHKKCIAAREEAEEHLYGDFLKWYDEHQKDEEENL
jgi:hypothetical protein